MDDHRVMKRGHEQTNQLHVIDRGARDAWSSAPQSMLCTAPCIIMCIVFVYAHVSTQCALISINL